MVGRQLSFMAERIAMPAAAVLGKRWLLIIVICSSHHLIDIRPLLEAVDGREGWAPAYH
jgi:hypothetical protein